MSSSDEDVIADLDDKKIDRHLFVRYLSENQVILDKSKLPVIHAAKKKPGKK